MHVSEINFMSIFKKLHKEYSKARRNLDKKRLKYKNFTIISNNCWGGFVYQHFELPYASPFVGLYLFAPDYIKMLKRLDYYLELPLTFIDPETSSYREQITEHGSINTYPVGLLDDIELHFLHYKDEKEATEKWERRKKRINLNKLIVKFCDRDLCTEELIREFDSLQFEKKVCLTAKQYSFNSCIKLKNENSEYVTNEWENFMKTKNLRKFINRLQ